MHAIQGKLTELRRANDLLRTTWLTGNLMWQPSFRLLAPQLQLALLTKIKEAPEYDPARDPNQEHAAGFARQGEHVLVWSILYYDGRKPGFQGRSPDPSNPRVTRRVLLLDYVHTPVDADPVQAHRGWGKTSRGASLQ